MGKGLPRSMARGAALRQEVMKITFKVTNLTVSVDGATGVGFGTAVIGALPQGNILLLGAISYLEFDAPASGIVADWDGDYAIGSAPTADATLSGGEVDIVPSTATTQAVATVAPRTRGANATQVMLDNTDGSLELNLNLIVDDAGISADDVLIVANGEVTLLIAVLGDD